MNEAGSHLLHETPEPIVWLTQMVWKVEVVPHLPAHTTGNGRCAATLVAPTEFRPLRAAVIATASAIGVVVLQVDAFLAARDQRWLAIGRRQHRSLAAVALARAVHLVRGRARARPRARGPRVLDRRSTRERQRERQRGRARGRGTPASASEPPAQGGAEHRERHADPCNVPSPLNTRCHPEAPHSQPNHRSSTSKRVLLSTLSRLMQGYGGRPSWVA